MNTGSSRLRIFAIPLLFSPFVFSNEAPAEEQDMADLLALLNTPVVSASKSAEKLSMAPATMIILTRNEMSKRGYTELTDALSDLPGMQTARAYGDSYVKNYWRGFRNFINDPYLLMVDGVVQNSLYFNRVDTSMTTLPLSNIDRVEVVYGPASVVYGSNAFMGVINVITRKDASDSGTASFGSGSNDHRFGDATYSAHTGDLQIQASFRFDNSVLDDKTSESYEYTKNRYYSDPKLWGVFANNPTVGGSNHSESLKQGIDIRVRAKNVEIGFQDFDLRSGYGNEYAADMTQNIPMWHKKETNFFLKHSQDYTETFKGSTLIRYRQSGVLGDSAYLDGYQDAATNPDAATVGAHPLVWGAAFSFWQVQNHSTTMTQDFDWKVTPIFGLNFGFSDEKRDVQKPLTSSYGDYQASGVTTAYHFPQPLSPTAQQQDRAISEIRGLYLQGRVLFGDQQSLILGGRRDSSSAFEAANTFRMGYVGNFGGWSAKALFGQAFQEPVPRLLYGGWKGSGSDPNLKPETSDTIEVSGGYTTSNASADVSLWSVKDKDVILGTAGSAKNLGDRTLRGVDLHFQAQTRLASGMTLRGWGYFSFLIGNSGTNNPDATGAITNEGLTTDGKVGDLSKSQAKLGLTLDFLSDHSITLLARYIGARDTVSSNPAGSVDAYTIADLVYYTKKLFVPNLGMTIKISNIGNKTYFEPGVSQGNAGITPGSWSPDGFTWTGSKGYFSSLLAQPGREMVVSLSYRY